MEIIKKGLIIPEEQLVANRLSSLPNLWWCLAGDNNRFSFKKGEGTQIDFIVINPKGIFLIDAKNVSSIELTDGDIIKFYTKSRQQVRKSKQRNNPIEDIINEKYLAKDWLKAKGIAEFMDYSKKDLKVFIHSFIVLANEDAISYKNCSLNSISYYNHKYKTLLPLSELNENFFNSIALPSNCSILSKEDMWLLFKIFYNPSLSISQLFQGAKDDSDKLFNEKQVFIEKIRLIEEEHNAIQSKLKDLEGTRNELISLNQSQQSKIQTSETKLLEYKSIIEKLKHEKDAIEEDNKVLLEIKDDTLNYNNISLSLENTRKQLARTEKENKKLQLLVKDKRPAYAVRKRFKQYILASSLIFLALIAFIIYSNFNKNTTSSSPLTKTGSNIATIEQIFPKVKNLFGDDDFSNIIRLWEANFPEKTNMISTKDFHVYDKILYYIGFAYLKNDEPLKAIKYFDMYSSIVDSKDKLRDVYFYRSIAHINTNTELDRAILDLKKALQLNKEYFNSDYKWAVQIIWNIANCSTLILKTNEESKRLYYARNLGIKDFYAQSVKQLKRGRNLASANNDIKTQAKFQIELGHIYNTRKNYRRAIEEFKVGIILIESTGIKINEETIATKNALGSTYSSIKQNNQAARYYTEALNDLDKAFGISINQKKVYEAQINRNLGSLLIRTKQYKKSLPYLEKALSIARELDIPTKNYEKKYEEGKKLYEAQ